MAAMREVRRRLERDGWRVQDVNAKRVGFDLDCRRGRDVPHVEVKGVRGPQKQFILTHHEAEVWNQDDHYCLLLVTEARSGRRSVHRYSGAAGRRRITRKPIAYVCVER
jgi:hypothetical protein